MEADREQKQHYLRDQILEGGHDPATFGEYLDGLRPNGGSDVDVWTMNELIQVVESFKNKEMPVFNEESQRYEQGSAKLSTASASNYDTPQKKSQEEQHDAVPHPPTQQVGAPSTEIKSEDDHFYKTVPCQELPATSLVDDENTEIFVSDPELVKGGLFTASYIVYKVTTKPLGWLVKRRFSDFHWLREYLTKMHPTLIIPPTPKKKTRGKFENEFIARRMAFLEKFMNSCLQNDEVNTDRYFISFLQIEDESKWKAKKKDADALKKPHHIREAQKQGGQAVLQIGPELRDFASSAAEMVYQSEPLYKKMRKLSKQLILDFDQVSNTIFNLGETFGQLYKISNTFNKHSPLGQNSTLEDVYLTLNNTMVSWGEQMLGQIRIVQHGLNNFFKYAHFEHESTKDIIKQRNTMATEFVKFKRHLDLKKEKNFHLGDISKWEIPANQLKAVNQTELTKSKDLAFSLMFPKDSATELEMRDQFAYFNFEAYAEITSMINKKCKAYMKNFQQFAKDQSENLSEVHVHWADVLAHFSEAKMGGSGKNTVLLNKNDVLKNSGMKNQFNMEDAESVLKEDA